MFGWGMRILGVRGGWVRGLGDSGGGDGGGDVDVGVDVETTVWGGI